MTSEVFFLGEGNFGILGIYFNKKIIKYLFIFSNLNKYLIPKKLLSLGPLFKIIRIHL